MTTKFGYAAIIAALLLAMSASDAALAQHGGRGAYGHGGYGHGPYAHGGVGVYVGVPLYSPWYYPPAYYPPPYYYPPAVVSTPPVYVEQQVAPAAQTDDWFYCGASKAYYPYVKECPGGWQRVAPQPG